MIEWLDKIIVKQISRFTRVLSAGLFYVHSGVWRGRQIYLDQANDTVSRWECFTFSNGGWQFSGLLNDVMLMVVSDL